MSLYLVAPNTDEHLEGDSPLSSATFFDGGGTFSCWMYATDWGESDFGRIIAVTNAAQGRNNGFTCYLNGGASKKWIRFSHSWGTTRSAGELSYLQQTTPIDSVTLNAWYHVACTYDADSRSNLFTGYINGVEQTLTNIATPSVGHESSYTDNKVIIGASGFILRDRNFDGYIADMCFWDTELTAPEIASLAAGAPPHIVRPASLAYHWPLNGFQEVVGGTAAYSLFNGASFNGFNPPIQQPQAQIIPFQPAAAPAGNNPHYPFGHPFRGPFAGPIG